MIKKISWGTSYNIVIISVSTRSLNVLNFYKRLKVQNRERSRATLFFLTNASSIYLNYSKRQLLHKVWREVEIVESAFGTCPRISSLGIHLTALAFSSQFHLPFVILLDCLFFLAFHYPTWSWLYLRDLKIPSARGFTK